MYNIIGKRKIWFGFSGLLSIVAIVFLALWGLKLGIDFTGGSILEVSYSQARPSMEQVSESLADLDINSLKLQPSGEYNYIIRFEEIAESTHQAINTSLSTIEIEGVEGNEFSELRFEAVGPVIGNELKTKAVQAIVIVLVFIVLYIAFAFRKVSKPVASWKFGIAAIIALVHDVLIIAGIFAALGYFMNIEVDSLFVTALLTILGFSVHDTIVTFDRTRENLFKNQDKSFNEIVNISVNQTIIRSINTSVTTLLVLMAIYFFGGDSIKNFVLALILGVIIGTYSSIFLASPLLTIWRKGKSQKL
jgi:preprotein translocase subunit SecF